MSKHNKPSKFADKQQERKFFMILIGVAVVLMVLLYLLYKSSN